MLVHRHADGTGRDGYIVNGNGGFHLKYKQYNYDNDLRKYDIIERAPFDKIEPDFGDY